MPWTAKQHRLFAAAAHDPEIARRKGLKSSDSRRMAAEGVKSPRPKKTLREDVADAYDAAAAKDETTGA